MSGLEETTDSRPTGPGQPSGPAQRGRGGPDARDARGARSIRGILRPPGPRAVHDDSRGLRDALRRPGARIGLTVIVLLVLAAVAAPLITALTGTSPTAFDRSAVDETLGGLPLGHLGGISTHHLLGVEPGNGRDVLARLVYGARVSLLIALAATALSTVLGAALGLVAGYFGGLADTAVSRLADLVMSFPALIFMIALMAAAPGVNRQLLLITVLGFFGWPYVARIVRGQAMVLRHTEFAEAARALGADRKALLFREILPNLAGPILVLATMSIPSCVAAEAGLSFLGVGVKPPTPSWGQMIASAVPWGLALQFLLVTKLGWLPYPTAVPISDDPVGWFESMLMPWITLATLYAGLYARITRGEVLENLNRDFVRTARAKGLPKHTVIRRHALRPGLTPIVTIFGMDLGALLGGALITETVFGLPGVGKLAADAIAAGDQPVILGVTLLVAGFIVVANVAVDLLYAALDPRVRSAA